jgi:hypothetical protein
MRYFATGPARISEGDMAGRLTPGHITRARPGHGHGPGRPIRSCSGRTRFRILVSWLGEEHRGHRRLSKCQAAWSAICSLGRRSRATAPDGRGCPGCRRPAGGLCTRWSRSRRPACARWSPGRLQGGAAAASGPRRANPGDGLTGVSYIHGACCHRCPTTTPPSLPTSAVPL